MLPMHCQHVASMHCLLYSVLSLFKLHCLQTEQQVVLLIIVSFFFSFACVPLLLLLFREFFCSVNSFLNWFMKFVRILFARRYICCDPCHCIDRKQSKTKQSKHSKQIYVGELVERFDNLRFIKFFDNFISTVRWKSSYYRT